MKYSIMVVDDDPNLRVLLQQMLAFRGFDVVEAENGVDALKKIDKQSVDAIVLDVMMPVMNGIEVCKTLRQNPAYKEIPIIMLSGKVHQEAIREGLSAGATKYLCKPIPMGDLIEEIKAVLQIDSMQNSIAT